MNKKSIIKDSQTDWERISKMSDEDIDLSDIPEVSEDKLKDAQVRFGGKPIPKEKIRVNIFLDTDIVAYFKTIAGGRDFHAVINDALRNNIRQQKLERILRRVIREELQNVG